jgi:hypothetical protein
MRRGKKWKASKAQESCLMADGATTMRLTAASHSAKEEVHSFSKVFIQRKAQTVMWLWAWLMFSSVLCVCCLACFVLPANAALKK